MISSARTLKGRNSTSLTSRFRHKHSLRVKFLSWNLGTVSQRLVAGFHLQIIYIWHFFPTCVVSRQLLSRRQGAMYTIYQSNMEMGPWLFCNHGSFG